MKIALALICKGTKEEAKLLDRCLKYASPFVDGTFITITGGSEPEEVERVCKKHNANISHFTWVKDFSKARNFNFSQVNDTYDYILWLDADDVLRGGERIRPTISKNPDVDIFQFLYLYSFDENNNPDVVHTKARIVKNDGCVEWAGALHEDFKYNRKIVAKNVNGIEVLHLSNEKRFNDAKDRNVEIAQKQVEDDPSDPRSYWNLGNSLKAKGFDKEALIAFDTFIDISKSDDEKYIAYLRMAEAYWNLNEKEEAVKICRYAIGTKVDLPDAYFLLGDLFLEMNKNMDAIENYKIGLTKETPKYNILVFNPRDYDYRPMMNMAKAYFNLHLPTLALPLLEGCLEITPNDIALKEKVKIIKKEADKFNEVNKIIKRLKTYKDKNKIKKELDKIDLEMQAHPAICNLRNTMFIKEKSSGKDLVFYCGYTEREWDGNSLKEGIGGSEEAIIHLSNGLAKKGWNVVVYNNCGYKEKKIGDVLYKPFWSWNYRDKQDVVVLWRNAMPLDYDINSTKIFVDVHDVMQPGEFSDKRMSKCDGVFLKSEFHKTLFPNISQKCIVIPNGIKVEDFTELTEKDDKLLIHTSSPDRGLKAFIDGFRKIKKEIPDVKGKWCYGWGVWDVVYAGDSEKLKWKEQIQEEMREVGIEELGMISHKEVAELYKKAKILAYPSEFAEIDMISLTKAIASNCIPITTDFAAMGNKKDYGGIYIKSDKNKDNWCPSGKFDFSIDDTSKWSKEVIKVLKGKEVKLKRDKILQDFSWNKIVDEWEKIIK